MRLSAVPLINFQGVNSFCSANQWIIRNGDSNTLYFQLVDLDQTCGPSAPGNSCGGGCGGSSLQRYVAGVGTQNQPCSMIVTFSSIDSTMVNQITAVQNPNDGSIWSVTINSNQCVFGGAVFFSLTQGNNVNNFSVLNMLCVEYVNAGSDGSLVDVNTFTYDPYGENSGV